MLEGKELEKAIAQIMKRLRIVNITYIKKIAAQIKKIGELNPSSVNRLVAMSDMNADIAEIRELLRVTAAVNAKELRQVFTKAVTETKNDPRFARYLAKYPLKDAAKQRVERFVQSLYRQTAANMYNYSNTTAITQGYSESIDKAVLATATGVSSYTETMRDTIREIGHAGLQVQYESGYHRRLDTAVRQNIVDAVNQINKNAGLMIGEELGYDAVEISAHARSAPDHEPVQGHVFMLEEYEKMQSGLMFRDIDGKVYEGFRRPIGEWNCGHTPMSFSTKYSSRKWTNDQLQAFIDENQNGCVIDGKHRTLYEASQMMRNIETQVRREKDTAIAAQTAGDEELRQECQRNINALVRRYAAVAKASGNAEKRQRMTVEGFRAVKVKNDTAKLLTSPLPDGTIKEKEAYVRDKIIPNLKTDAVVPRQQIHIQGTKMYIDRQNELAKSNQHGPGYLTITDDEVLALVREYKGKGRLDIYDKTVKWNNQEVILTNDKIIGIVVNKDTGKSVPTSVFKIHYSTNGIHIVPDYPSKKKGAKK